MKSNKNNVIGTGIGPLVVRSAGFFSDLLLRFRFTLAVDSMVMMKRFRLSDGTLSKGSFCDLILFVSDVILALTLWVLYKPVNRCIALISIVLRLVQSLVHGVQMLCPFFAMKFRNNTGYYPNLNLACCR